MSFCLSFPRSIIGRRFFFIVGTLYLYRCITMYITTLPVPGMHFKCSPKVPTCEQFFPRSYRLVSNESVSLCKMTFARGRPLH